MVKYNKSSKNNIRLGRYEKDENLLEQEDWGIISYYFNYSNHNFYQGIIWLIEVALRG